MATVYRKTFTKPLPAGAEIVKRNGHYLAKWRDANGRMRTALTTAGDTRVVLQAATYTAKYRTAGGQLTEAATGCRDKDAAKAFLAELVRREELVKAKVLSRAEADVADAAKLPIGAHVEAYLDHLGVKTRHGFRLSDACRRWQKLAERRRRMVPQGRLAAQRKSPILAGIRGRIGLPGMVGDTGFEPVTSTM